MTSNLMRYVLDVLMLFRPDRNVAEGPLLPPPHPFFHCHLLRHIIFKLSTYNLF